MSKNKFKIQDNSNDRKYFSLLPHYILNHSTAVDQALYMQMKKYTGETSGGICWASKRTLMQKLGVGIKSLNKSINYLIQRDWIKYEGKKKINTAGGTQEVDVYSIKDIWKQNIEHYAQGVAESTPPKAQGVAERVSRCSQKDAQGVAESTPNKNHIKQEPYNKIVTQSVTPSIFNLKEEIKKMEDNNRRDLNIIAFYFNKKETDIQNRQQLQVAIRRHLKPAGQLKPFTDNQLSKALKKAQKEYPDIWTLETLLKLLTK